MANLIPIEALPTLNAISHTTVQLLVAIPLAVGIDWAFDASLRRVSLGMHNTGTGQPAKPTAEIDSWRYLAMESLELGAQVVLGSMITGFVLQRLVQLGPETADPNAGFIFSVAFYAAQPLLMGRLQRITAFLRKEMANERTAIEAKLESWGDRQQSVLLPTQRASGKMLQSNKLMLDRIGAERATATVPR